MAKLFERAASMLTRNLQVSKGIDSLTVTRGGSFFTLAEGAWMGNVQFRMQTGEGGARMESDEVEFHIPASAYDFGAGPVEPQDHDVLTRTINGVSKVFRVLPPQGSTEPAWNYSDPEHTLLRVYAKGWNG